MSASGENARPTGASEGLLLRILQLGHFPFETLCVSNHTAWCFAEKTQFFRLLWGGRRCASASHFAFFNGKML